MIESATQENRRRRQREEELERDHNKSKPKPRNTMETNHLNCAIEQTPIKKEKKKQQEQESSTKWTIERKRENCAHVIWPDDLKAKRNCSALSLAIAFQLHVLITVSSIFFSLAFQYYCYSCCCLAIVMWLAYAYGRFNKRFARKMYMLFLLTKCEHIIIIIYLPGKTKRSEHCIQQQQQEQSTNKATGRRETESARMRKKAKNDLIRCYSCLMRCLFHSSIYFLVHRSPLHSDGLLWNRSFLLLLRAPFNVVYNAIYMCISASETEWCERVLDAMVAGLRILFFFALLLVRFSSSLHSILTKTQWKSHTYKRILNFHSIPLA